MTDDRDRDAWADAGELKPYENPQMTLSITAHRGDDEPWRLARLASVAERIPKDTLTKIDTLGDITGTLFVTWRVKPTRGNRLMVERSWRGLYEENVRLVDPIEWPAEFDVEHIAPASQGESMVRSILGYSRRLPPRGLPFGPTRTPALPPPPTREEP